MNVVTAQHTLAALLHLSSPSLPIGGFSYSQGLEAAVELGLVHDASSASHWIEQQLRTVVARSEAPLWCLLFDAWQSRDRQTVEAWNTWFHASRETQELRQETTQMGRSLYKLSLELQWADALAHEWLDALDPITLPCAHTAVCVGLGLARNNALTGYLFTWLENQVTAAIKSVPLGQVAGRRILYQLQSQIPHVHEEACRRSQAQPPSLNTFAPQYTLISSRHETQFSRLFRS